MFMEWDMTTASLEELHALRSAVIQEIDRRDIAERAARQIRDLTMRVLDATGRENGAEWVAPVGAHDSYPIGWEVAHSGKVWRSLVTGNVWEPGDLTIPTHAMLWEEVVVEEPEEPEAPTEPETPSVQEWNGSSVTYLSGDLVTFNGATYRCITGHTSQAGWTPAAVPALWAVV